MMKCRRASPAMPAQAPARSSWTRRRVPPRAAEACLGCRSFGSERSHREEPRGVEREAVRVRVTAGLVSCSGNSAPSCAYPALLAAVNGSPVALPAGGLLFTLVRLGGRSELGRHRLRFGLEQVGARKVRGARILRLAVKFPVKVHITVG